MSIWEWLHSLSAQYGVDPERIIAARREEETLRPGRNGLEVIRVRLQETGIPEPLEEPAEPVCVNCQGTHSEPQAGCMMKCHFTDPTTVFGWERCAPALVRTPPTKRTPLEIKELQWHVGSVPFDPDTDRASFNSTVDRLWVKWGRDRLPEKWFAKGDKMRCRLIADIGREQVEIEKDRLWCVVSIGCSMIVLREISQDAEYHVGGIPFNPETDYANFFPKSGRLWVSWGHGSPEKQFAQGDVVHWRLMIDESKIGEGKWSVYNIAPSGVLMLEEPSGE